MPQPKQEPAPRADDGYRLHPSQVPDFPASLLWVDQLRWCLAVMDADDPDLGFAASLLSHAVDKGGLTEKQGKYASRIVQRVQALWLAEALSCQRRPSAPVPPPPSLSEMATKGQA